MGYLRIKKVDSVAKELKGSLAILCDFYRGSEAAAAPVRERGGLEIWEEQKKPQHFCCGSLAQGEG